MTIDLTDDEALVLYDLLCAYPASDEGTDLRVRHPAERSALWSLAAQLEKKLAPPSKKDYDERLAAARARLAAAAGAY